LINHNC